jgi:hypothetical protein
MRTPWPKSQPITMRACRSAAFSIPSATAALPKRWAQRLLDLDARARARAHGIEEGAPFGVIQLLNGFIAGVRGCGRPSAPSCLDDAICRPAVLTVRVGQQIFGK